MNELKKYRKLIDDIDGKILFLLKKRFGIVRKIGVVKAAAQMPVMDKKRLKELYRKRMDIAERYGLPKKLIKKIYKDIVAFSMVQEKKYKG